MVSWCILQYDICLFKGAYVRLQTQIVSNYEFIIFVIFVENFVEVERHDIYHVLTSIASFAFEKSGQNPVDQRVAEIVEAELGALNGKANGNVLPKFYVPQAAPWRHQGILLSAFAKWRRSLWHKNHPGPE